MSFLRTSSPVTTPTYTGLQLQTASSAIPVAILYGLNKLAPNIICSVDFTPHFSSGKGGGGGKGGALSSVKGEAPSSYTAAVQLALCEGPIVGVQSCWDNTTISLLASPGSFVASMNSPGIIPGDIGQAPWTFLSQNFPAQALGYSGLAMIVDFDISMGSSATLDSYSFETQGKLFATGFNSQDADPAAVISDFLTNPQYGVGFPVDQIDMSTLFGSSGDASYQTYCFAAGLAFSPALTDQEAASSILERWLQLTNTAAFWSEGQVKFRPYGDTSLTGALFSGGAIGYFTNTTTQQSSSFVATPKVQTGSVTFNPDVTPIYNLTDDDFIAAEENDDPLTVQRTDPLSRYNMIELEILQRSNFYDATPIYAFDQSAIDQYGLRIAPTVTANEICDPGIAQTSAQLILQRDQYIRNHYTFKLSWEYGLLEPMDLVTLTDPNLGLENVAVRITSIAEDDNGLLTVTAEEFPAGVATAVAYPVEQKNSTALAANAPASPVNPPILFEPPYAEAGGLAVYAAISGQVAVQWGGAFVWASTDGTTFNKIGQVNQPARMGVTTTDLPAVASFFDLGQQTIDTVHTLGVNLTESNGTINPATQADMLAGTSACFIGTATGPGEIIAFQNAVMTGTNQYALSVLQRGTFDSIITDHPSGSSFAAIDGAIFKFPYQPSQIGATIFLKFQSFNAFGAGAQDLSDCAAFTYTITGSPLLAPVEPPQNPVVSFGTGAFAELSWDEITDSRGTVRYLVFTGPSTATAQQCGDVAHPPFRIPNGPGTYYVKSTIQPLPNTTVTSDFSQSVDISGSTMIVANDLDSFSQAPENWPGTLVNMRVTGTSPDEGLLLAGACNVDFGQVSLAASTLDDFGAGSDNVITILDLGSLGISEE